VIVVKLITIESDRRHDDHQNNDGVTARADGGEQ
jgi:hypothetical protein